MMIYLYFAILLVMLFFSGWEIFNFQKKLLKKKIFYILVIFLILFCGCRPMSFDKDIKMYFYYFKQFCNYSYHDVFFYNTHRIKEKGYILYNKFFCEIGFRPMILSFAILGLGIKSQIIFRKTLIPITALFLYTTTFFPLREFTQIRDAIASSFVIMALVFFYDRKILLSLFYFFIALSFHLVAIVYIPVVLMLISFKNKIYYYVFLAIASILFFFKPIEWIYSFKQLPFQILKYESLKGEGSFFILLFVVLVIAFYHISIRFKKIEESYETDFYLKISYLAISFGLLTFYHQVMFRLTNILVFFTILLLTKLILSWQKTYVTYLFLISLIIFYFFGIRNFILINL